MLTKIGGPTTSLNLHEFQRKINRFNFWRWPTPGSISAVQRPQPTSRTPPIGILSMAHPLNFLLFAVTKKIWKQWTSQNRYCMMLCCWGCPNGKTDPECPVHEDSPTPCLIILVTLNPMDIVWYYGVSVRGVLMKELILNAQYMWTHPPLV